ncbi:hypothetical protein PENTCL1PPCAC_3258 [Pristionchus entomophagus]|uniref:Sulfotransferase domain-containing protein n=1 Tax=Pristionchus entomophagus TaxID=358040 RepID=A0AAV5SFX1_9BILA|nr:hypothetical protein PENTCL1PPCAC_3258 [Pristionchus entomophagus]
MSELLLAITFGGDTEKIKGIKFYARVPWIEMNDASLRDIIPDSSVQSTEAGKGPFGSRKKVFRTHMYPECLPRAVKEKQTKVVYVARNPKDVAVSYFFFHQLTAHLGQQSDSQGSASSLPSVMEVLSAIQRVFCQRSETARQVQTTKANTCKIEWNSRENLLYSLESSIYMSIDVKRKSNGSILEYNEEYEG